MDCPVTHWNWLLRINPRRYSSSSSLSRAMFTVEGTLLMKLRLHTTNTGKEVEKIARKKHIRPKLLPEKAMVKTINLIKVLRLKDARVTVNVINAIAKRIRIDQWLHSPCWTWLLPLFQQTMGKKHLERTWKNREEDGGTDGNHVIVASGLLREEKYTFQKVLDELVNYHLLSSESVYQCS